MHKANRKVGNQTRQIIISDWDTIRYIVVQYR